MVATAYGRIYLLDTETGGSRLLYESHEDWIRCLRVSSDGRLVASSSQNATACVYDLEADQPLADVELAGRLVPAVDFDERDEVVLADMDGAVDQIERERL